MLPDAEIFFYGSRVTGNHRQDSDYDVLVILDRVDHNIRRRVYDIAWEVGFKHDILLSPVLSLKKEFHPASDSLFLNHVRQSGVAL